MNRRVYLSAVCSAGFVPTAGCTAVAGERTLSEPTVKSESDGRRSLIFTADDTEVGKFGVDGRVDSDRIELSTEIWHQKGTNVESIKLRVWMPQPESDSAAEVAVVSPVEGDSSPPPSVELYTPDQSPGTIIEITDLDDLADETISTLTLTVEPGSEAATTLVIHATIELTDSGVLGTDYTLDGELESEYSELDDR